MLCFILNCGHRQFSSNIFSQSFNSQTSKSKNMFRCSARLFRNKNGSKYYSTKSVKSTRNISIPESADVVIIGGGSAGCNSLYHLAKRGVNAVLLERTQLTAGTTWHTSGLVWRLRPNDVEVQLLNRTRDTLKQIQENTEYDSGWIGNGGLFIARNKTRLDEYKRLASLGRSNGIECAIISPKETQKVFPLLNPEAFYGALHSPGDGVVDPSMMCTALTRLAKATGCGNVIEHCPVEKILTEENARGTYRVIGVETPHGIIRTECVVNAAGVWTQSLLEPLGISLPLIPMKHSYVVSEPIDGVYGMPNVRDHDASVYLRIQGSSIMMGGYEDDPIILDRVANDFSFGLYDLDWSVFEAHVKGATELCPAFGAAGIKSTVCGPESFTPDHKPLMGPDPRCNGLVHNCGFNSAGMMLGSGCGEQIAEWIVHGRPEFDMSNYDVRRFRPDQNINRQWATERSHESYAKNYSMVFKNDQPLAGRNFIRDALHADLIEQGAVMGEKHGYEVVQFFDKSKAPLNVPPYDWYGAYGNAKNTDSTYLNVLTAECTYDFPQHLPLITEEAVACRKRAALFNLSNFGKFYLTGKDARKAVDWICTADINRPVNETVYTCALNGRGGVESDFMVTNIESGSGQKTNPKFDANGYYIVVNGSSTHHTLSHIESAVAEQNFDVDVRNVTDELGILSIQGPQSRNIVQKLICFELNDEQLPVNGSTLVNLGQSTIRIHRVSYVGELGYELHVANEDCSNIYRKLLGIGAEFGLQNAGHRAFYALNLEKGKHQWGYDLRPDDTPIEAGLSELCRPEGIYQGHDAVAKQRAEGIKRRLVQFTVDDKVPLWSLEGVYRDGVAVGHLRRADFGHTINKSIGSAYVKRLDGQTITDDYLMQGKYEIDVMGKLYEAKIRLI